MQRRVLQADASAGPPGGSPCGGCLWRGPVAALVPGRGLSRAGHRGCATCQEPPAVPRSLRASRSSGSVTSSVPLGPCGWRTRVAWRRRSGGSRRPSVTARCWRPWASEGRGSWADRAAELHDRAAGRGPWLWEAFGGGRRGRRAVSGLASAGGLRGGGGGAGAGAAGPAPRGRAAQGGPGRPRRPPEPSGRRRRLGHRLEGARGHASFRCLH